MYHSISFINFSRHIGGMESALSWGEGGGGVLNKFLGIGVPCR